MRPIDRRQFLYLLRSAAALALAGRSLSATTAAAEDSTDAGEWLSLSDLAWDSATTGWLGIANHCAPALNTAFPVGQISLGGQAYDQGIGVYPRSEITYVLDRRYLLFASDVGMDDRAQDGSAARFLVFVDDTLRFESSDLARGGAPDPIQVNVEGARTLRLVVDAPADRGKGAYADWADARLLKATDPAQTPAPAPVPRNRPPGPTPRRQSDESALRDRARRMILALPLSVRRPHDRAEQPASYIDRRGNMLWLSTGRTALGVNIDNASYATITLLDLRTQRPVLLGATASITLDRQYQLNVDAAGIRRGGFAIQPISDPALGRGLQLILHGETRDQRWQLDIRYSLFASDVILYDIAVLNGNPDGNPDIGPLTFQHLTFDAGKPTLWLDDDAQYLTEFSRLSDGRLPDDGTLHCEAIGEGRPLFFYSESRQRGLLTAFLDHTAGTSHFQAQLQAGQVQAGWGLDSAAVVPQAGDSGVRSARLYMEITPTADARRSFDNLRALLDRLVPQADLPRWFKFQWLSWYVYGMADDAAAVQRQAEYIAANLADLGPWNVLIDAGWYVSEGRPDADWRTVDESKFPGGMTPLVERLHQQDIQVVLYLSVPYIDSVIENGHWLAMHKIVEDHPEWLLLMGNDGNHQSYCFDFRNPEVLSFWSDVMDDFFVRYGVDGIKIDGVGNAEGAALSPDNVDMFGLIDELNRQTMPIYEFFYNEVTRRRPDGYIETGWLTPTFARPYVHTIRYGDEVPRFSSPYPTPGMVEHIDYAIFQKQALGMRANMGAIFDNPNASAIDCWWLQAGLALGAHVTLGFDLAGMTDATLNMYRSLLAHYQPFTGTTMYGPGIKPRTFATTKSGTTCLGILNRDRVERTIPVPLADLGLSAPATAYDVENNQFLRLPRPFAITMAAESFRLFIVRTTPGILWTNNSFTLQEEGNRLILTLRGPSSLQGYAHIFTPRVKTVQFDGKLLSAADTPASPALYSYDQTTSVLSLFYDNQPVGHTVTIEY